MAFDYFTLHTLAAELRERIGGTLISRAGRHGGDLVFTCQREWVVRVRVGPRGALFCQPGKWPGQAENEEGAERYLVKARVDDVRIDPRDRIVRIRLERRNREGHSSFGQLVVELIHPQCLAALVSERNGEVLGKWGTGGKPGLQRVAVGRPYRPPVLQDRLLPGQDTVDEFGARMRRQEGEAGRVGASLLVGMDRLCFAEVAHRAGVLGKTRVAELGDGDLARLWDTAVDLYRHIPLGGVFVWEEEGRRLFSALEPTRLGGRATRFDAVSQAVFAAGDRPQEEDVFARKRRELLDAVEKALKRLLRRMAAVRQDLAEAGQAEEMERTGNSLLAQLHAVPSGAEEVELMDVYDMAGREKMRVRLDPRRTPVENASWYLKNARKFQRRCLVLPGRLARSEQQLRVLADFQEKLQGEKEADLEPIERWLTENGMVREKTAQGSRRKTEQAHPRRYRTSTGWSVWAGRNNRENDLLTHRLTAQNDLWFHAHGYSGSHVVLRREGRKEEPSARTIEEAARIAAYWSKGKTARRVPVVYTLAKYVSKPRGGAPGQAVLRREKTIMVEPGLLPIEDEEKENGV